MFNTNLNFIMKIDLSFRMKELEEETHMVDVVVLDDFLKLLLGRPDRFSRVEDENDVVAGQRDPKSNLQFSAADRGDGFGELGRRIPISSLVVDQVHREGKTVNGNRVAGAKLVVTFDLSKNHCLNHDSFKRF